MEKEYPVIKIDNDYYYRKYGRMWAKPSDDNNDSFYYSFKEVDRQVFPIYTREIVSANLLEATAGTTGYQGGDSGHGCRTFIRICNQGSTDIRVKKLGDEYGDEGVEIILGGDCELDTIIEACKFIADVLENQKKNVTIWDEDN